MHVALNWLFMHPRAGGVGTAAREVVPRMLAADPELRLTIMAGAEADDVRDVLPWKDEVTWVRDPVTVTHGPPHNALRTLNTQWVRQPLRARRLGCDVLHGPANSGAVIAPGVASIVTVHDLIWMAYPTAMSPRDRLGTRLTTVAAARAADLVLTDSQASCDVLVERLGLDQERIRVVPLGVEQEPPPAGDAAGVRARLRLGRDEPVLLCVSQKRSHKNLTTLLRALAAVPRADVRLVIPGATTPYEDELRDLAAALGLGDRLVLPDWLAADELEALYETATAVVLPSLEEGFGLPVLDAMVRGAPVACSNRSSLAEVAGDAALLFDPLDPHDIANAIARLLDDEPLRARLVAAGRKRALQYTWERTAQATLASYREARERRKLLRWDRA